MTTAVKAPDTRVSGNPLSKRHTAKSDALLYFVNLKLDQHQRRIVKNVNCKAQAFGFDLTPFN